MTKTYPGDVAFGWHTSKAILGIHDLLFEEPVTDSLEDAWIPPEEVGWNYCSITVSPSRDAMYPLYDVVADTNGSSITFDSLDKIVNRSLSRERQKLNVPGSSILPIFSFDDFYEECAPFFRGTFRKHCVGVSEEYDKIYDRIESKSYDLICSYLQQAGVRYGLIFDFDPDSDKKLRAFDLIDLEELDFSQESG